MLSYVFRSYCFWEMFPWSRPPPLTLKIFLPPLLYRSLNLDGVDLLEKKNSLKAECSKVSHSPLPLAHDIVVDLSANCYLLQEGASLVRVE